MNKHPRHGLDELIHAPIRLSILATLSAVDRAEFSFVRDTVEISDSALSKQISALERAGYVTVKKGYVGKRPRTWLSMSAVGRTAYDAHLAALTEIARGPMMGRPGPEQAGPSTALADR